MGKSAIETWRHLFKLDPDREISDETLEAVCSSPTDGVIVGGTQNITYEKTYALLSRIRRYSLPCLLEVSSLEAVVRGFDLYLLPVVLNASDPEWIFFKHIEGLKRYARLIPWEQVLVEGYLVGNPHAAVARLTRSRTALSPKEVKAYAILAERILKMPVFYVEFSGQLGKLEWLEAAREALTGTRLFYGGGIHTCEEARQMGQWADTLVVGNALYTDLHAALTTAAWAKKDGK